jgi:hypothetical protein
MSAFSAELKVVIRILYSLISLIIIPYDFMFDIYPTFFSSHLIFPPVSCLIKISFPITLENPHIINKNQVLTVHCTHKSALLFFGVSIYHPKLVCVRLKMLFDYSFSNTPLFYIDVT